MLSGTEGASGYPWNLILRAVPWVEIFNFSCSRSETLKTSVSGQASGGQAFTKMLYLYMQTLPVKSYLIAASRICL